MEEDEKRVELSGQIRLHTLQSQTFSELSTDLSVSGFGVRIEKRHQLTKGSVFMIEFFLPSGLKGFTAQVEVVRVVDAPDGRQLLGLRVAKSTKLMEQKLVDFINDVKHRPD